MSNDCSRSMKKRKKSRIRNSKCKCKLKMDPCQALSFEYYGERKKCASPRSKPFIGRCKWSTWNRLLVTHLGEEIRFPLSFRGDSRDLNNHHCRRRVILDSSPLSYPFSEMLHYSLVVKQKHLVHERVRKLVEKPM